MASSNLHFNPLLFIIIQKSTIALLLAFSSAESYLRLLFFPIFVIFNILLLPTYKHHISRTPWIAFVSGEALSELLDYVEKLLLSQWSYVNYGPYKRIKPKETLEDDKARNIQPVRHSQHRLNILSRLRFGLWTATSTRYIASPYQARKVPPYSSINPSFIPTRRAFLFQRAMIFTLCYLFLDILTQGNQYAPSPVNYAPSRVPFFSRLHEVTVSEILLRFTTTVFYWIGAYLVIEGYYSFLSFISVLSTFDRPELCRPNFGSFSEAYTIRGFWGVFWHQQMRKRFSIPARYITFQILSLPRTTSTTSRPWRILSRYTELFSIFLMSGILHHANDVAQGLSWTESGAIQFFILMAIGIVIEDAVQWVFYDFFKTANSRGRWWAKAVGYVWAAMFFTYATPLWAYPPLMRSKGAGAEVLPFSILRMMK